MKRDQRHAVRIIFAKDQVLGNKIESITKARKLTGHTKKDILKAIKTGEPVTKQVRYSFIDS